MRKKLVKRPLLAYASGKKGDVYGYDWGFWDCVAAGAGTVLGVATTAGSATAQQWGLAYVSGAATAVLGSAFVANCIPDIEVPSAGPRYTYDPTVNYP